MDRLAERRVERRVERHGLDVAAVLADFIEKQAIRGTGIGVDTFWSGLSEIVHDLGPTNRALMQTRAAMQAQIDDWHRARRGQPHDGEAYQAFLQEIGYLVPEGPDFEIETANVDVEIAQVPGPQLVVPVTNARFALNAANARWGSLYDALYGTDALGDLPGGAGYDAARGERVIGWGRAHLDKVVPLDAASWAQAQGLSVEDGALVIATADGTTGLADPAQFIGYTRDAACELQVLLTANGLLIEILIDRGSVIGRADAAGISDIRLESAMTTIMDCEDSVATVDAADKVLAYGNWLGLMKGDLEESFVKGGRHVLRRMNADAVYTAPDGGALTVKRRSLMLVRNVGDLMTTPAILDRDGNEIGEGLMDAMVTTLIAMHDLQKPEGPRNSARASVYVVKPKMHGPQEVAFADQVFTRVEEALGLPRNTVKLGIMDEERRTSVNLKECIRAARHRVAFINTGFLDRTGDEIHTSMEAGPMIPKGEMKNTPWIRAYEDRNVDIGLACGLRGRA